jgi:hypothetical protein
MLARLSPVPHRKGTNKAASFGLEAIIVILMSNKLPGMSYEEGHCYNDAYVTISTHGYLLAVT